MKRIRLEGKKKKGDESSRSPFFISTSNHQVGGREEIMASVQTHREALQWFDYLTGHTHTHTHTRTHTEMFLNTFSRFFETYLHALALIKKTLPHTVNTHRMRTESWVCSGRRDACRSVCKQEVKLISNTK